MPDRPALSEMSPSRALALLLCVIGSVGLSLNLACSAAVGAADAVDPFAKSIFASRNACIVFGGAILTIACFVRTSGSWQAVVGKALLFAVLPLFVACTVELLRTYHVRERAHQLAVTERGEAEVAEVRSRNLTLVHNRDEFVAWLENEDRTARTTLERKRLKAEIERVRSAPIHFEAELKRRVKVDASQILASHLGMATSEFVFYDTLITAVAWALLPVICFGVAAVEWRRETLTPVNSKAVFDNLHPLCPADADDGPTLELTASNPDQSAIEQSPKARRRRQSKIAEVPTPSTCMPGGSRAPSQQVKRSTAKQSRRSADQCHQSSDGSKPRAVAPRRHVANPSLVGTKVAGPPVAILRHVTPKAAPKLASATVNAFRRVSRDDTRGITHDQVSDASVRRDCIGYWSRGPPNCIDRY